MRRSPQNIQTAQCRARNLDSASAAGVAIGRSIGVDEHGTERAGKHREKLVAFLRDEVPCVRIAAAEVLCRIGGASRSRVLQCRFSSISRIRRSKAFRRPSSRLNSLDDVEPAAGGCCREVEGEQRVAGGDAAADAGVCAAVD